MLSCHSCIKRCLQIIVEDATKFSPPLRIPSPPSFKKCNSRAYSSRTPTSHNHQRSPYRESDINTVGGLVVGRSKHAIQSNRERWLESRKSRPGSSNEPETAVVSHLQELKDPLRLAEFTRKTLASDDFETALVVVRAASKRLQCTVSWNHLVDWQLGKGKMNAAFKTFNEMKKRAQIPDAHTFTILIRGCAEHKMSNDALAKVLALYYSMLADKSAVKPNTIHMNAILKMCARAQNLEAMFGIVEQMPAKGVTAPNNLTFTTIINACRTHATIESRSELSPIQKRNMKRKAILDARLLWKDVMRRWHNADIIVDEELVCAMGRMLLLGDTQDLDDILSLLQQTMNIPRQIPRLGTNERNAITPASQGKAGAGHATRSLEASVEASGTATEDIDAINTDMSVFTSEESSVYVKPGQNSLSLILRSLFSMGTLKSAARYWNIFVLKHGVNPDAENYHEYLRILRLARASNDTVELLSTMPHFYMASKTFRISMSTCMRDKLNHRAFANAGKLLDIMQSTLSEPDIPALQSYLELAVALPVTSNKVSSAGVKEYSKRAHGAQILRALHRLGPSFLNIKTKLDFGSTSNGTKKNENRTELADHVLVLTRRIISAYDMLINNAMVTKDQFPELSAQRSKLAAFVTRRNNSKRSNDPQNLNSRNLQDQQKTLDLHVQVIR